MHPGFWLVMVMSIQTLVYGISGMANDPGLGWHLASGRWMLENNQILFIDPFLSITRSWISDQWFSDIVFYKLFSIGKWEGLYILILSIFTLLIFNFHFKKLRADTKAFLPVLIGCLFALKAMHVHLIIRPVVFSFPLFLITFWSIRSWEKHKLLPIWLPVIFLLWANLHPSFVLGFVLLGIGALVVFIKGGMTRISTLILILCFLSTFMNPYGASLHESIIFLGQNKFFMNLNLEWKSPTLESNAGFLVLVFSVLGILPTLLYPALRQRVGWYFILSNLFFLICTISSIRFLPYFGMVGSALIAHSLGWLVWRLRKARKPVWFFIAWAQRCKNSHYVVSVTSVSLVLLLIISTLILGHLPGHENSHLGPKKEIFPYDAVKFLKNADVKVVASIPDWGGFITWFGDRKLKPVIDDRNTLLGEQPYRDFLEAFKHPERLIEWGRAQGGDVLLLPKVAEGKSLVLDKGIVVYEDRLSIIYKLSS